MAAAGLYVYGDVADFKEGVDKAYAVLSSGKAITKVRSHCQKQQSGTGVESSRL